MHTMKETRLMKILRINNHQGEYSLDGVNFSPIDTIGKNDLLNLIDKFIAAECEMDAYMDGLIGNPAHKIIYQNIYDKFKELEQSKDQFRDMRENTYKDAINKYRGQSDI